MQVVFPNPDDAQQPILFEQFWSDPSWFLRVWDGEEERKEGRKEGGEMLVKVMVVVVVPTQHCGHCAQARVDLLLVRSFDPEPGHGL